MNSKGKLINLIEYWVNRYGDKPSFDENGVSICPNSNLKYQLLNNKVNIIDE